MSASSAATDPHARTHSRGLLGARGVSMRYAGIHALEEVDIELHPGEILALVGDNGAGKSTLLGILSGSIAPTRGTVLIDGKPRSFDSPSDATACGIAAVYQDLALALHLDVAANLFLGRERIRASAPWCWMKWLDRDGMEAASRRALERVHIRIGDVRAECASLSGGQRQAIAIARAITWCDRALLLDEPTAALGVEQQAEVLSLLRTVRDQGIGTLLVTHQLPHVLEVADRIAVLRRGRLVACLEHSEATVERLVALITGLDPGSTNGISSGHERARNGTD
ncbi:MAG: ATP-binding cassette domain-containing protein [Solirubrobacteraceae bacterium]